MNLRLEAQTLRLRLSATEFEELAAGRPVRAQTVLGQTVFAWQVALQAQAPLLSISSEASPGRLELALGISRGGVALLREEAQRKEGLQAALSLDGTMLGVTLDVDLKSRRA